MCEDVSSGEDKFGLLNEEDAWCFEGLKGSKLAKIYSSFSSRRKTDFTKKEKSQEDKLGSLNQEEMLER
ncbi:hypothetical protein ACROYT_G010457 [Oculina patagonica]